MSTPVLRTIETNGIRMRIAEQGEGPLVLLLHGFPESWYSWRHQLPALAEAGFHAVAPDQRGYGGTEAPEAIEAYNIRELTADAVGVLDALGERTAVVVGHDWGAPVAWHCALLYPDRFRAVVGMSVPYTGRPPAPPTQIFRQIFAGRFFYMLYFQEPGVAERELDADPRRTLRLTLYSASGDAPRDSGFAPLPENARFLDQMTDPETLPAWLTEADLDYFAQEFERTGFRGGLNWYRNLDRNWELTLELAGAKIQQPALFIAGDRDVVIAFMGGGLDAMKSLVPNLRGVHLLPGCGHWTQQERPAEVNRLLVDFLRSL
ncbi:MAG: alpha/beta hydrolase [Dehalococcoidia bacterium]|nr:alpha/beta hydrolase [Dehalococcoidia bacterium]